MICWLFKAAYERHIRQLEPLDRMRVAVRVDQ